MAFTTLDDFLPIISYMIQWSLENKKMRFLLISWLSKTEIRFFLSLNHVEIHLNPQFLIKSGYYVVPSPSTDLRVTKVVADHGSEFSVL